MKFNTLVLRLLVINILLFINFQVSSQSNNYGLKLGLGLFNQNWEFEKLPFSGWKDNKTGIIVNIFGEINHSSHFGSKLELGYLRKGYYNNLSFEAPDGTIYDENSFTIDLNTFSLQLSERITFLKSKLRPYVKIGLNIQYIPKGEIENLHLVVVDRSGQLLWYGGQYTYSTTVDWNSITLNGNIGIGLTYNEVIFIEIEYSKSITPLLNIDYVKVNDRYYGLSVGVNINKLF